MTDIDTIRREIAEREAQGYVPTGIDMNYAVWERILRKVQEDTPIHEWRMWTAPVSHLLGLPVTITNVQKWEVTYAPR